LHRSAKRIAAKVRTMKQVWDKASSARRFSTALLAFFAIAALFRTIMGIYGVVAFLVGRRRREIGIRMAWVHSVATSFGWFSSKE
jgi:hypothetical protein